MEFNFDFWNKSISAIHGLSTELDKKWRKRNRKIDTFFLIIFIIKLVLKPKTGYQLIIDEIWDEYRSRNLDLPQENPFAQSSVCEARQKFKADTLLEIHTNIINQFFTLNDKNYRWNNFRVFAVDSSHLLLPSELKKQGYKRYRTIFDGVGNLSCLYHVGTGIILDSILDKYGNERQIALNHFDKLRKDDVIIYDRGYFGYSFIFEHLKNSLHFIIRVDKDNVPRQIEDFINDPNSPSEIILEITPSQHSISKALKHGNSDIRKSKIKVRIIKYQIKDNLYYLATSLINEKISVNDFSEIYHKRWEIEEHFKLKKSILDIQKFHSKNENGVLQEIYCATLLINISRIFACDANSTLNLLEKKIIKSKNPAKIKSVMH